MIDKSESGWKSFSDGATTRSCTSDLQPQSQPALCVGLNRKMTDVFFAAIANHCGARGQQRQAHDSVFADLERPVSDNLHDDARRYLQRISEGREEAGVPQVSGWPDADLMGLQQNFLLGSRAGV